MMSDFYIPKKSNKEHWYKEPWMLLVVGGPFIVVIAAVITFYIAWQGSDNVVSKDYYKQGINIDKILQQDKNAIEYQLNGTLQFEPTTGKVTLSLNGRTKLPSAVLLTISFKTGNSEYETEKKIALSQMTEGVLEGLFKMPTDIKNASYKLWHVKVEGADWRLIGDWIDPLKTPLQLKAQI